MKAPTFLRRADWGKWCSNECLREREFLTIVAFAWRVFWTCCRKWSMYMRLYGPKWFVFVELSNVFRYLNMNMRVRVLIRRVQGKIQRLWSAKKPSKKSCRCRRTLLKTICACAAERKRQKQVCVGVASGLNTVREIAKQRIGRNISPFARRSRKQKNCQKKSF